MLVELGKGLCSQLNHDIFRNEGIKIRSVSIRHVTKNTFSVNKLSGATRSRLSYLELCATRTLSS